MWPPRGGHATSPTRRFWPRGHSSANVSESKWPDANVHPSGPTVLTTGRSKENYGCLDFQNVHRLLPVHRLPRGCPHGHAETADRILYRNGRTTRTVVGHWTDRTDRRDHWGRGWPTRCNRSLRKNAGPRQRPPTWPLHDDSP